MTDRTFTDELEAKLKELGINPDEHSFQCLDVAGAPCIEDANEAPTEEELYAKAQDILKKIRESLGTR